jgi:hypothetical protein
VERSLNKCCTEMHLMTKTMLSYGIPDNDCPELKNNFENSVDCECETGSTSEKTVNR